MIELLKVVIQEPIETSLRSTVCRKSTFAYLYGIHHNLDFTVYISDWIIENGNNIQSINSNSL